MLQSNLSLSDSLGKQDTPFSIGKNHSGSICCVKGGGGWKRKEKATVYAWRVGDGGTVGLSDISIGHCKESADFVALDGSSP